MPQPSMPQPSMPQPMSVTDVSTQSIAFRHNGLNRLGSTRADDAEMARLRQQSGAKSLVFTGDQVVMAGARPLIRSGPVPEGTIFLGLDEDDLPWFACTAEHAEVLLDLRSLARQGTTPPPLLGRLAQARSLLHWHDTHRFCSRCGVKTAMMEAGYRRHCPACEADHFPRTDPVVIIAVRGPQGLLLGRQDGFPPGLYSTLAGFMEPGETIEDAARREVFEEAGVRVGSAHILFNQPWPFPASLMIGLLGQAESTDITIDKSEISDARWFGTKEIGTMLSGQHPDGLVLPPSVAIAHRLIITALSETV